MKEWIILLINAGFQVYIVWWNHDYLKTNETWTLSLDEKWLEVLEYLKNSWSIVLWPTKTIVKDRTWRLNIIWLPDISSHPHHYLWKDINTSWPEWSQDNIATIQEEFRKLNIPNLHTYHNQQEKVISHKQHVESLPIFQRTKEETDNALATILMTHSPEAIEYYIRYSQLTRSHTTLSLSWHTHGAYFDAEPFLALREEGLRKLQQRSLHGLRANLIHWTYSLSNSHIHHTSAWFWMHPDTYTLKNAVWMTTSTPIGNRKTWAIRTVMPHASWFSFVKKGP